MDGAGGVAILEFLRLFALAFIPLFVAMEPVGVLPVYLSLTDGMDSKSRRHVLSSSVVTAAAITLTFLIVGKAVFTALGITIADFQIAGGLVLVCIAISDIVLTSRGHVRQAPEKGVGVVPIGTPLIAGPAALTTLLMLNDLYGLAVTLGALAANLFIIWFIFMEADRIVRYIGEDGARAVSKVISLLLAAIAVMIIRKGIMGIIAHL